MKQFTTAVEDRLMNCYKVLSQMAVSNAKAKAAQANILKVHSIHRHRQGKHEQLLLTIFGREIARELSAKDNFYWMTSGSGNFFSMAV